MLPSSLLTVSSSKYRSASLLSLYESSPLSMSEVCTAVSSDDSVRKSKVGGGGDDVPMSRRKQLKPKPVKDGSPNDRLEIVEEELIVKKSKIKSECPSEEDSLLYDCQLCNEQFATIGELQAHTLTKHVPSATTVKAALECQHCDSSFSSLSSFATHMRSHLATESPSNNNVSIRSSACPQCHRNFDDVGERLVHLVSHFSATVVRRQCVECGFIGATTSALLQHCADRHLKMQHVCTVCGAICETQKSYKEHTLSHLQDVVTFECNHCRVGFESRELLGIHVQLVHDREDSSPISGMRESPPVRDSREMRVLQCSVCDERCVGEDALDEHRLFSHCKVLRADSCADCGDALTDALAFAEHTRKHARDMYMQCAVCRQSLRSETQLLLHCRFHMAPVASATEKCDKEQQCEICCKTLVSREQLAVHLLEHDPFRACPHCPLTFPLAHLLLSHVSESHQEEDPPFVCSICGERFQFQIQHEHHRIMSHGVDGNIQSETLSEPNIMSFSCSQCPKVFGSVAALQQHSVSHRDGVVRRCPVCSLSFNTLSRFENHVRKHANTSCYSCQICAAGFTKRDDLDVHMRVHKNNLEMGAKSGAL